MANVTILELVSLAERHPKVRFLESFGVHLVVRLSIDPVDLSSEIVHKDILFQLKTPRTAYDQLDEIYRIGWQGVAFSRDDCLKARRTSNENRITEDAAIAVMALVIHELESATIEQVLQIGSGGDYLITIAGMMTAEQVEVSGIREDAKGSARSRLRQKLEQVGLGYASVTLFHCPEDGKAYSFLHHVKDREIRG